MAHYDSLAIETVTFNGVVSGESYKANRVLVANVSTTGTEYDAVVALAENNYATNPPQVWH